MSERDELAGPEPEEDQVTEIEVAEDRAEQVQGGPEFVFSMPGRRPDAERDNVGVLRRRTIR